MTSVAFGQEKYTAYENRYYDKKYDISVFTKDSSAYELYIDMFSIGNSAKKGGIIIESSKHTSFLNTLNDAKGKYKEWVNLAKENNVPELYKTLNYEVPVIGYFQFGGRIQLNVNLTFDFKIVDNKYLLIIGTGKLTSTSNEFITADGFIFVFQNENEIDDMINILSVEKVKEFMNIPKSSELSNNYTYDRNKPKSYELSEYYLKDRSPVVNDNLNWESLNAYSERSETGYTFISFGIGSLIVSNIISQIQLSAITNNPSKDVNFNIPIGFNYLGLGFMLIGSTIKLTSYKLLKKDAIVSIGMNSVCVNF